MNEFICFQTYLALKLHFENKFDYFKYGIKVKYSPKTYAVRTDRHFFRRLSKKYEQTELVNFFLANIVYGKSPGWIGDFVNNESVIAYNNWKKNIESLSYNFKKDCELIAKYSQVDGLLSLLCVPENSWPGLLDMYMTGKISLETLVILDEILMKKTGIKLFDLWNSKLKTNPIWGEVKLVKEKYAPFLKFDSDKMTTIYQGALYDR